MAHLESASLHSFLVLVITASLCFSSTARQLTEKLDGSDHSNGVTSSQGYGPLPSVCLNIPYWVYNFFHHIPLTPGFHIPPGLQGYFPCFRYHGMGYRSDYGGDLGGGSSGYGSGYGGGDDDGSGLSWGSGSIGGSEGGGSDGHGSGSYGSGYGGGGYGSGGDGSGSGGSGYVDGSVGEGEGEGIGWGSNSSGDSASGSGWGHGSGSDSGGEDCPPGIVRESRDNNLDGDSHDDNTTQELAPNSEHTEERTIYCGKTYGQREKKDMQAAAQTSS